MNYLDVVEIRKSKKEADIDFDDFLGKTVN